MLCTKVFLHSERESAFPFILSSDLPDIYKIFLTKLNYLSVLRVIVGVILRVEMTSYTKCQTSDSWDLNIYASIWDFQTHIDGEDSTWNASDTRNVGSIPGSGRSPGGRNGNPLQYSWLENPTDRGACWVGVGVQSMRLQRITHDRGIEHTAHTGFYIKSCGIWRFQWFSLNIFFWLSCNKSLCEISASVNIYYLLLLTHIWRASLLGPVLSCSLCLINLLPLVEFWLVF